MDNYNQQVENETSKSGVSISEIIFLVKKNIVLIVVITIIATIIGFVYGKFIQKPTYSAKTTAIVQVDSDKLSEYNSFVYASYLVDSFSEFIVSESVTKEIAREIIDDEYEFTHTKNDEGNIEHFSKVLNKTLTNDEYEKKLLSKSASISSGIKISIAEDSLIINITYSSVEDSEKTKDEVEKITKLIVSKTQEVAKTLKNEEPTYKFPIEESNNAVKYAYIKMYNLEPVKDSSDNIIGYKNNDNYFTLTVFNSMVESGASILGKNFSVAYDGDSLVMSIKNTSDSVTLDAELAAYCLIYLNDYALDNPKDDAFVEEYLYPTFANKLVSMGNANIYAVKSTKTVIITLIGFVVGFIASCGVVLVRYLIDDTFTSKDELELFTGLNILASINQFEIKEGENNAIK